MKYYKIIILILLLPSLAFSQDIYMKIETPEVLGTVTATDHVDEIKLNNFQIGASRFLDMTDLGSNQRSHANTELSLGTISFPNNSRTLDGIHRAIYENTLFGKITISIVASHSTYGPFPLYVYELEGVKFASLSGRNALGTTWTSEATFKATKIKITLNKVNANANGIEEVSVMQWNFQTNNVN